MPSKILLLSTNRCATPDPVFPLGLAHVNASLRQAGHDTRWIDFHNHPPPLEAVLREYRPDFVGLSLRNIDDVLIRKQETYFGGLADICQIVRRQSSCPVVLGGSGFSIFPEQLLKLSSADFGICGEGEVSFCELIASLNEGASYEQIPGLVFRQEQKVMRNPQRVSATEACLQPEDRPPSLVRYYLQTSSMLNLQTQRGCGHHCCYCTYPLIESREQRRRPAEFVAEEMAQLQACGAKYVFIVDSIFNSSTRHVVETCEAILRRHVTLRWGCFLRPQGLTADLVTLMARAGLAHIEFGSDSLCDSVLEEYGKRLTFQEIFESNELARKAGIDCCHFLICGGPGETRQTLQTGYRNSKRLPGTVIMAVVGMRIYPGTTLWQRALGEGLITKQTDLLMPAYYLAPGLTPGEIFEQLSEFARGSPNWIVGDPAPAYAQTVQRLRGRGIVGPLWGYFSMMQRLWPQPKLGAEA